MPPKKVLLDDSMVLFCALIYEADVRKVRWPANFDSAGDVRAATPGYGTPPKAAFKKVTKENPKGSWLFYYFTYQRFVTLRGD